MRGFTQLNSCKANLTGFTLIEILLVVGILAILTTLVFPLTLDFYKSQQLDSCSQGVVQTLRRAQLKAMSSENDSNFGVYLTNDSYILFKGDSYENRDIQDVQYDEVFDLPQILTVSGIQEVVFLKFEGTPKGELSYCHGTCLPCSDPDFSKKKLCDGQDGCSWIVGDKICSGICSPCNGYENQLDCEEQLGCSWRLSTGGGDIILNSNGRYRVININEIGRINLEL